MAAVGGHNKAAHSSTLPWYRCVPLHALSFGYVFLSSSSSFLYKSYVLSWWSFLFIDFFYTMGSLDFVYMYVTWGFLIFFLSFGFFFHTWIIANFSCLQLGFVWMCFNSLFFLGGSFRLCFMRSRLVFLASADLWLWFMPYTLSVDIWRCWWVLMIFFREYLKILMSFCIYSLYLWMLLCLVFVLPFKSPW